MALFAQRKYYIVKAKFGHVGRDKYLPLDIPVRAINKKDASAKAKRMGGVKRDHPDWCLKGPTEVSKEEFIACQTKLSADPYWNKKTRQNINLFKDRLVDEPNYTNHRGLKTNTVSFKKPTTAEIKMFHKRKQQIVLKDLEMYLDDEDE